MTLKKIRNITANKSIANSVAERWSNRLHIALSFGSDGRNSFEHQNKFLIFEQIMNSGCQAEVFQLPHHRQYLIVSGIFLRHTQL